MSRRITVPFFIPHHGCPHRCVFCDQTKITGTDGQQIPSPGEIRDTIEAFRTSSAQPCIDVAFFGGTFTSLPTSLQEKLLGPLQELRSSGAVGTVRVSTRPDAVDGAAISFLVENGVSIVELGAQSLDDEVLKRAGRGHSAADVGVAVRLLREKGLQVGLQLMVGLPGDTRVKYLASLQRALELRPDFLRIYPTLVIAGTQLEELYRQGAYEPLTMEQAVDLAGASLRAAYRARVPVIRIGLQPTEELSTGGSVMAGPYHPAFGQLVRSRLCYDLLASLVHGSASVTVRCAPGRMSDVVGQRRSTIERLFTEHGVTATVETDPRLAPLELEVETAGGTWRGHIMAGVSGLSEVA